MRRPAAGRTSRCRHGSAVHMCTFTRTRRTLNVERWSRGVAHIDASERLRDPQPSGRLCHLDDVRGRWHVRTCIPLGCRPTRGATSRLSHPAPTARRLEGNKPNRNGARYRSPGPNSGSVTRRNGAGGRRCHDVVSTGSKVEGGRQGPPNPEDAINILTSLDAPHPVTDPISA